jgi:HK97 family phage major capsid protein
MPSPKLARLQDESATITAEIETLRSVEPADDAEKARVEGRMAELSRRADELGIEAKAERDLDAKLEALRSVRASDSDARKAGGDEAVELRDKANHSIAGGLRGFTSRKAANAVGEYLRQVVAGECRAMGETSPTYDAKGVDFVMGELYGAIVNRLTYSSVGLQLASVYTPSADRITVPKIGDATVSIVAEGSATTDQDLSTSGAEVRLYEYRLSIAISRSLLEDSPLDVAGTVAERIGVAYAKQVDSVWLGGNASSPSITGLAAAVAAGNTITVAANAATTVNNLADVVGKVDESIMGNGAWVCSRAGWVDLMKLWSAQQTTMTVGGDRVVPTIFGAPVYLVKGLPATTLALYGDYKLASAIAVKANGLEIEVGRELLIRQRQVLYAACQRVGVSNHDAQYVGRLAKAAS